MGSRPDPHNVVNSEENEDVTSGVGEQTRDLLFGQIASGRRLFPVPPLARAVFVSG
jgi:hypothetical protein